MSVLDRVDAELDRRHVEEEADSLSCRGSLSRFVTAAWQVLKPNEPYVHGWHIDAICEKLEAVSHGEVNRLAIWIPPGTMKTGSVSVFWPAWEWTRDPWLRYWTASYETRLAGRMSSMSRDLMLSDWYQQRWGDKFRMIREGEHYFGNNQGGTRLATAPESTGSGEHGHRIIIDDPINAKKADATSRTVLNDTNEWYDGTVVTRGIGDDHARVLVMQRLHENDLAGHVLEMEDWTVLCLPERYEADHPFVWPDDPRQEGELLWPAHRGEEASNALAKSLTSFRAAGQLQQRPAAREGEILKRAWWNYYDPREQSKLGPFAMILVSVDTPLKDKQSSDNVACQCWGVKGGDRYLLDLALGKMNYLKAKRTIKEMSLHWRRQHPRSQHRILIENAGYGVELIGELKRELPGVTKISPGLEGDKIMRAEAASSDLESGNCFLPGFKAEDGSGPDEHRCPADTVDFVANCATFPHVTHDDDVDAWSQAMIWLRGKNATPMRGTSALKHLRNRSATRRA